MDSSKILLRKLSTTLWKCLQIRKRHYMLTLFVIGMPILLFGLIAWGRTKIGHIGKQYVNETTYIPVMSEEMLYKTYKVDITNTYLLYAPATNFTDALMHKVQHAMEILNDKFQAFDTVDDLLVYYTNNLTEYSVYGVIFDNVNNTIPQELSYSIRNYEKYGDWQTDLRFSVLSTQYIPHSGSEVYFNKAFLNLQLAIDKTFLKMLGNTDDLNVEFSLQEFPYPPHYDDVGLQEMFMSILPLVTVISTLFIFPGTLKRMMEEKQTGIKELMKMMGLPPSIMYLAWFIDALIPCTISVIICTVFMKVDWGSAYPPIEYCNGVLFGIFLFLYFCSCIAFCLFFGTLHDSPSITTTFAMLVWTVTYSVPFSLNNLHNLGYFINILLCLLPNFALYNAFHGISVYEVRGIGVQWYNLFTSGNGRMNDITFGVALIMFVVDIMLFLVLGYYIDQVKPGKHGLPKPWHYPITNLINCYRKMDKTIKRRNSVDSLVQEEVMEQANGTRQQHVEKCNLEPGVIITNLTKRFGEKVAVNNLSLKFYNGEIAGLLGRNGAGKTTTMSILTGMLQATNGEVIIDKYDISENLGYIRTIMGICPQHDLLFPELSVEQHLVFFAKLNGISDTDNKITNLLKHLGLFEQRNKLPSEISGGMKRKLCFGMAIIVNPKVLIMDEPTSGLDPKSRRDMWNLILNWRSANPHAVIIVSTHFMEEADVLGDRITIIEQGRLIAQGSPMYLKREIANECKLTLRLRDDSDESLINGSQNSVHSEFPDVRVTKNDNTYVLHWKHKDKDYLIDLLSFIDKRNNVENVGISISTLEDVFLKLTKFETPSDAIDASSDRPGSTASGTQSSVWNYVLVHRYGGLLYLKRYAPYVFMAWVLMLLLAFIGSPNSVGSARRPGLKLDLDAYGNTLVYFSLGPRIQNSLLADEFRSLVIEQGSKPIQVSSVSDALIELGVNNLEDYKEQAVVALEFNETANNKVILNMMYSNLALHGAPIILNMAASSVARSFGGKGIVAANVPLQSMANIFIDELTNELQFVSLWVVLAPIALLLLVSSYIYFPFIERVTNFKHLLYMAGDLKVSYWLKMFFYHFFWYFVTLCLLICTLVACNKSLYGDAFGCLLLMLVCYGIMMIPFVFLFSYRKSVAAAVGSLSNITIFTGIVFTFVIVILRHCGEKFYETLGDVLHVLSHLSPQYWLTNSLITFSRKVLWRHKWEHMSSTQRDTSCKLNPNACCPKNGVVDVSACDDYKSFYEEGLEPLKLFGVTVTVFAIYILTLCLLDSMRFKYYRTRFMQKIRRFTRPKYTEIESSNEGLVEQGIALRNNQEDVFSANNLKIRFNNKEVVKGVSFAVRSGQCYGLLGVNGAGKTTTFKMLTGFEIPTVGNATVKSKQNIHDLNNQSGDYFRTIGYCPQFNAINEILTARYLLTMFANLRNVEKQQVQKVVQNLLNDLALTEFADVPCGHLSGGNKRKLCLGISIIGNPAVHFLDEPTTGVDPVSRRKIWEVIQDIKKHDASLVLTSHSMDECEILCDHLAIMSNGLVHVNGSINKLKLEYGNGLTIKIKLKERNRCEDQVDGNDPSPFSVSSFMDQSFHGDLQLKDKHEGMLHYFLPKINCGTKDLLEILNSMESLKQNSDEVVDYTINTSTLEDIFLKIARESESDA